MEQLKLSLRTLLENELQKNEVVSWYGRPSASQRVKASLTWFFLSIPLIGVVSFGVFKEISESASISLLTLLVVPILMIGVWMMLAPLRAWRSNDNTVYVITNLRAFIFEAGRNIKIIAFDLEQIDQREKRVQADGSGDIILNKRTVVDGKSRSHIIESGFLGIDDVHAVETQLQSLTESITH